MLSRRRIIKTSRSFIFFSLIFTLLILTFVLTIENITTLHAKNGMLNFSSKAFDENQIYNLSGEWQMINDKLLNSESFDQNSDESYPIKVPGPWQEMNQGNGYATYRLILKDLPIGANYGIEIHDIRSASQVIVNDYVLLKNGKVSENIENSEGRNVPRVAYFETETETTEIIIQVSNYEYPSGGILGKVYFASQEKMHSKYLRELLYEIIMLTLVFAIGLIYWMLRFVLSKKERIKQFSFILGCSSIFIIIINGLLSHKVLHIIFPNLEFILALKILFLSIGILSILVGVMVKKSHIVVFSSRTWMTIASYYGFYLLLVLVTNIQLTLLLSKYFLIVNTFIFILIAFKISIVFIKEQDQEKGVQNALLFLGISNYIFYSIDLTLYYLGIITEMKIAFISILLYSLFLMLLLLYYIYLIVKNNEAVNIELKEINKNLVKTIQRSEKYQLEYLNAQIKPHFLFNTLSTIISLCETNKDKACLMIKKLSEYLKSSYEFSPDDGLVEIGRELQLVDTYLYIQKQRFEERLEYEVLCAMALFNYKIPQLMIQPIIENAIIHGVLKKIEGGKVKLEITEEDQYILISILDDGVGFDNNKKETFSTNIGLKNINSRLSFLYDEALEIVSAVGRTEVKFKVPKIE